jgi:autotransporter translocation and assembly factor TamB
MKSMRKPILIFAAIVAAGLIIVFGGLLLWIQSSQGLKWLQSQINAVIPGSVTIDSCRLSLLRSRLELGEVALHDPQGSPVAGFNQLSVTLSLWPLLHREIHLQDIRLRTPWADLTLDATSGLNLIAALVPPGQKKTDQPPAKDDGGFPFNIVCRSFQLTDGRLTFRPTDDRMRVQAEGITLFATGDLMTRQADLNVDVSRVSYASSGIHPPPARISVKARLDGDRLRLPTVTIIAGNTTMDLKGSAESLTSMPVVDGMLTIESQLSELKDVFDITGDYRGLARARLSLKGALANPAAQLGLTIDDGRIAGQPLDHFRLSMDLTDRQATVYDTAWQLADGTIRLNGDADLRMAFPSGFLDPPADVEAMTYALNLVPDIPNLEPWLKPLTKISGQLNGRIDIAGTGITPSAMSTRLTLAARGHHLLAPGMDRPADADLRLSAQIDKGRITIDQLDAATDGLKLSGTGRLGLNDRTLAGDLALSAPDLSRALAVAGVASVSGACNAALHVNGPLKSLQGALSLKATSLASQAAVIGDIDTRLRWDNGTVRMDRLDLTNHTSALTARGSLQLLAPGSMERVQDPPFTFGATSEHLDPGDFIDAAKGDFTLKAELTGSVDNPRGTIIVNGKQIEIAGQALRSFSLNTRVSERKLWIDPLEAIVAPGEQLTASGWVGLDQTMAIQVKSDGIAIASIRQLQDLVPGNGNLRLDTTARGSIQNPDIDGRLTISDVTINNEAVDDMHLTFGLHDMRIKAEGDLNVAMNAACDLRQGDFNVDLVFDDTETASYFKAAGLSDLHGKLSGRVNAEGNIHDARNARAQANLDALHLMSGNISVVKANRITMQLADRKLSIPEFEVVLLSTGKLWLKGDAQLDGNLNMAVNGRLPLAAAGAFNPELADAAGIVDVEGRVSGTTDAPLIDARIDLEDIGMEVPGLVQKLHDLNGRILLNGDTIRIQALKGFLDTGSFSLDGNIDHQQFTPTALNLVIKAKALPLEVPDTLSVLLNTDIDITGSNGTAEAKGEIVVLEGLYYKDVKINLLQLATERQRAIAPASKPLTVPYFDTVNLDVTVRHRQAFEVDNNLARLEISPDLQIGGTLARPIVNGRAQVKEGTVTFQKKTFEVTKGVIDFVNPYKTEAEIDISSQAVIRTWTITLAIKGPLDNLDLKLSSVPSETDSDILSLILFGRTGRELSGGESGAKRSTGQIMAEMIADTFGQDIKKNTGVDILEVQENGSSNGNDEEAGGVTVTVGKHLSDRMTVKYAVESKDGEIVQRAITEYKLLENILVSGFQDTKGIYGSELVFRIEFR